MEIKDGYKLTEIGVIPKDWEVVKLEAVLKICHGRSQKEVEVNDGKYPILGTGGKMGSTNSFLYNKPSVLIGRKGTIDKPKYMDTPFWTVDTLFYSEIKNNAVPKFIFYNFLLIDWYAHNEASGVPSLNASKIEAIKIPLPPLSEQKAIAEVLSDMDNLITGLERQIEKKRLVKQGAMQRLLTAGEDWEVRSLGEVVDITSGESPSKFIFKEDGIPYFKVEQLNNSEKYQFETPYYIKTDKIIPKGSLIFPKRGASILLNKVRILSQDSYMDTNLMTLTVSEELSNEFLYYWLIYEELWKIADTTSIPQINNKHIIPIKISLPPLSKQTRIATILSDMDKSIASMERELSKYRGVKVGLMQELLSGRKRLIDNG